ncbi:hypothetical protein IPG41_05570 [Candidatus Peregrinibacteria bacterium]|nr:MAG: hypothetical protein IPG41_05570 [Candidatus Peregrinibacteria bacterium]
MSEVQKPKTGGTLTQPKGFVSQHAGKAAFIGGMATLSGLPNLQHGVEAFFTAAAKQAGYSTASAVTLLSFYNFLEKRVKSLPAELVPAILPTLTTILLNYGLHNLKGTEEPLLSTLPTAISASIGFPIWHVRTRILQLWKDLEDIEIKLDWPTSLA